MSENDLPGQIAFMAGFFVPLIRHVSTISMILSFSS